MCKKQGTGWPNHKNTATNFQHAHGLQLKKFRPAKTARIAGENGRADRQNGRTIFIANWLFLLFELPRLRTHNQIHAKS
jgi:hypothetical protein